MADETFTAGRGTGAGKQLVEALANIWFQLLVLGVLLVAVAVFVGPGVTLWKWPALLGVPLVTWLFGRWYGRYSDGSGPAKGM